MDKAVNLEVTLFIDNQVWSGNIYLPQGERFLDMLNGIWARQPEGRSRFLVLHDVTIHHTNGHEDNLPLAYVNKSIVQLATTSDPDAARGLGAQPGSKPYPYREKSLVVVKLRTPAYTVTGYLHCFSQQKAWHVVEDGPMFLPLTNAEIHPRRSGASRSVPFVAVNIEHILSLQDEGLSLPTTTGRIQSLRSSITNRKS